MSDTESSEREFIVKALVELQRDVLKLHQRLDGIRSAARSGVSKPWRDVEEYGQKVDDALRHADTHLVSTLAFARQGMDSDLRSDGIIH